MKKKKILYRVICPFDESHRFPVAVDIKEKKKMKAKDSFDAQCPFCDKYVRVTIEKELKEDKEFLRKFGFEIE